MSRILPVTVSALMLASCAATYDRSAMPKAASGLQQEAVGCKAKWSAKELKTYSEWQACQLTAERSFVRTIKLTRMDAFEVYAADMQALAAERDANRLTDREVRSRANDIQWRFFADCGCKPERVTANFASFNGSGLGPFPGSASGAGPFAGSGSIVGPYAGDNIPSGNPAHPENIPRPN